MEKLTPAKRLKQLRQSGWLGFIEFMESINLSPRKLCNTPEFLNDYRQTKIVAWMGDDLLVDLYAPTGRPQVKMIGLSEQVTPKPTKKNKMVRRGQYR